MNKIQNSQSFLLQQFSNVKHCFFGRINGCSVGDYSSLNCSKYIGDNLECVCDNLSRIKTHMDVEFLVTVKQEHTSTCFVVDKSRSVFDAMDANNNSQDIVADAIVTKLPNVAIGIVTADCAPILLYDNINKIIGAAHAGWKGAFSGILESTISKMVSIGANANNIYVAIGPCISVEHYEVSADFAEQFPDLESYQDCFVKKQESSTDFIKHFFDISQYCKKRLMKNCGICEKNIDIKNLDTYSNADMFFSHRRAMKNTNGVCGRQFSAIALK